MARVVTDGGVKALPETGNPVGVPLLASGIALVVLGGGISVLSRRRNRAPAAPPGQPDDPSGLHRGARLA